MVLTSGSLLIKPLVSILIPAYRETTLPISLWSAIHQTWENCEIVISDDSESDGIFNLVENIKQYSNKPIKYVRNESERGEAPNLQNAFENCNSEYIKPLYDDDVLSPTAVASMMSAHLANPNYKLVLTSRVPVDRCYRPIVDPPSAFRALVPNPCTIPSTAVLNHLLKTRCLNQLGEPSCALFTRDLVISASKTGKLKDIFFFRDGTLARRMGDLLAWVYMLEISSIIYLPFNFVQFMIHEGQSSAVEVSSRDLQATQYKITAEIKRILDTQSD